jgi:thiol:disulfide interchange protein DsbC
VDNVTVYTFPYPILSPDSTQKVKDIWCSADPATAWEDWMLRGMKPAQGKCDVPVDKMLALGQKLMIRGTPGIIFADGGRVGGAIPLDEFENRLK